MCYKILNYSIPSLYLCNDYELAIFINLKYEWKDYDNLMFCKCYWYICRFQCVTKFSLPQFKAYPTAKENVRKS